MVKTNSAESKRTQVGVLQTPPAAGLTVMAQVVVEDIREIPGAEVVSSWKWPMLRVQTCSGIFLSHFGEARKLQEAKASGKPSTLSLWRSKHSDSVPFAAVEVSDSTHTNTSGSSLLDRLKG